MKFNTWFGLFYDVLAVQKEDTTQFEAFYDVGKLSVETRATSKENCNLNFKDIIQILTHFSRVL